MHPYNASPNNPNIATLHAYSMPDDGRDVASVTTVNPTAESMANDIHFMMRAGAGSRPHVTMRSFDGDNISVTSHGFMYVFNGTKWIPQFKPVNFTITPGGMANTWYYIYLQANNADISNPTYVVSTNGPNQSLTFGQPAVETLRYMGSFRTNSLGKIIPFIMDDYDYTYALPQDTNFSGADFSGAGPSDITFTAMSPYAKAVKLLMRPTMNASVTGTLIFTVYPKELGAGSTTTWPGYAVQPIRAGGDWNDIDQTHHINMEFPLFTSQTLTVAQPLIAVGCKIRFWWNGYKE